MKQKSDYISHISLLKLEKKMSEGFSVALVKTMSFVGIWRENVTSGEDLILNYNKIS